MEQFYLLTSQIRNLEQVDFIIVDVWLKLFWNVQSFFQRKRPAPRFLMTKIENQRHDWVATPCIIISQKLRPILCTIITYHSERHIRVRSCLVLKSDTRHPDITILLSFGNITFNFMESTICFIIGARSLSLQFVCI